MKNICVSEIYNLAMKDEKTVVVCADGMSGLFEKLASESPYQYVDYGIAEQCMIAGAAGIAMTGRIPFIYGTSNFLCMRGYEFLRNDICIPAHNVKIVGMLSGFARPTWGATHQAIEDVGLLRSLQNLKIITPSSPLEAGAAIRFAYKYKGPVYIRIEDGGEAEYFNECDEIDICRCNRIKDGDDVAIVCMGSIIENAIKAREILKELGISLRIINMPMINVDDWTEIRKAMDECIGLITLEEHSIYGGIGTIVSEIIANNMVKIPLVKLGIKKELKVCGSREYLRKEYEIDVQDVIKATKKIIKRM